MKYIKELPAVKFLLVGCVNVVVGTIIMIAAYHIFYLGYWLSSCLNYSISSLVSYHLNGKYTFSSNPRSWKTFGRFVLNILFCYVLAFSLARIFCLRLPDGIFRDLDTLAMLIGMALFSLLNYFGQAHFVFSAQRTSS